MVETEGPPSHRPYLTLGFATAVAMWTLGYVCRLPRSPVPSALLLALLVGCLLAGGVLTGRLIGARSRSGAARAGATTGVLASLINLLVLGGLVNAAPEGRVLPAAVLWIPGSVAAGALLGAIGGFVGRVADRSRVARPSAQAWTHAFVQVDVFATAMLLVVGGLVTSHGAGLAVVDWPNSFGYAMFLYPLSRMTGGVYFEHSHRLFGSLVGLTTLVLTVHLWRVDRRREVRVLALVALIAVIAQGILGGLRVTGRFTTGMEIADVAPNLALAVVHGAFAQVFFGLLVLLAAMTAPAWRADLRAVARPGAATDRTLALWLVTAVVAQVIAGAIFRHYSAALSVHLVGAVVVLGLGFVVCARARGLSPDVPALRRDGATLHALLGGQLLLGFAALAATLLARGAPEPPFLEVIFTTAHQTVGALVLGYSARIALWSARIARLPILGEAPVAPPAPFRATAD